MTIHFDKKMICVIIISLLIGGLIGGCVGTGIAKEIGEDRGGWGKENMMSGYDNQKDGEMMDDKGALPNSDEMATPTEITTKKVK